MTVGGERPERKPRMKTLGIGLVGARYGARMHLANYAKLPRDLV